MLETGQKFAHFNIIRKLGEGGMGEVYLAEDTKLNRKVALKVVRADAFDNAERQERFRREARTVASVSHPNVMGIYDIGTATEPESGRELDFIVMEYVEGDSLLDYLRDTRADIPSVIRIAEKIASGVAAAHKERVVHRDIKADNVIINSDGEPKILDFGLAKSVESFFEADTEDVTQSVDNQELTKAGRILGTVSYMSPEQSRGEKVDTRSDIFSFGVLLYRMTSGEFPFSGPTSVSTLAKILETRHEPVRLKNENIPPELERIIDKCLQKNPNDRYQDTRDLVVDLRNLRRLYDSGTTDTISSEFTRSVETSVKKSSRFGWKSFTITIIIILSVLTVVLEWMEGPQPGSSTDLKAQTNSLAIIGFENKTGDPELDWLETGLPEILLTDLAQAEAMTIISRERIIDCFPDEKKTNHTFDECVDAAAGLGAVNLLSGAFYKLGDKIRIDARLQDVATGNIVFGEKVIGDDPFTLVDSLTAKIAVSLNLGRGMDDDVSVSTYTSSSPEAYRHYRAGVDRMYLELYDEAIEQFNQALAIDSTFALPYMRIGMCYVFQGRQQAGAPYFQMAKKYEHKLPPREQSLLEVYSDIWLDEEYDAAFVKMASFIRRYSDDKEGHAIYALLVSVFTGDTTKALAHLDTALQIDPTYQLALSQLVTFHRRYQQYDRALEYARQMQRYHPESPEPHMVIARIDAVLGRIDDAIDELNGLLERFPKHQDALYLLSNMYIAKRDFDSCLEVLERLKKVNPDDSRWMYIYYVQLADVDFWRGQFKKAIADRHKGYQVVLRAGDSTRVFNALEGLADDFYRTGQKDSALYYQEKSHDWAGSFSKVDYPIKAVSWDNSRAEELVPLLDSGLAELQRRLPSELWQLVDNARDMFYAYAEADTNKIIEVLKANQEIQKRVNPAQQGRTLGTTQIKVGRYEEGKANVLLAVNEFDVLVSSYQYLSSVYYLGIAEEGLGNIADAVRYYEELLRYWGKADIQTEMIKDTRRRLGELTG